MVQYFFNLGIFSMQLYLFKDSFSIHCIKTGEKILSLGQNLREILEFPFLFLLFSLHSTHLTVFYKAKYSGVGKEKGNKTVTLSDSVGRNKKSRERFVETLVIGKAVWMNLLSGV